MSLKENKNNPIVSFSILSLLTFYSTIHISMLSIHLFFPASHIHVKIGIKQDMFFCLHITTHTHTHTHWSLSSSYFHDTIVLPLTGKQTPLTVILTIAPTLTINIFLIRRLSLLDTYSCTLSVLPQPFNQIFLPTDIRFSANHIFTT